MLDRDGRSIWLGYIGYNESAGIVHFDGDTVLQKIIIKDDIESNWITAIARDSSENIWFASRDRRGGGGITVLRDSGLTSYIKDQDGKRFGQCNALFVGKTGIVWTHAENGIARFEGTSWKLFDTAIVSPDLSFSSYSHIIQDPSGTVWFGTEGSGLLMYEQERWYQFTTREGLPSNYIRSCALDSKGNLWVFTSNGIAVRNTSGMVKNREQSNFINRAPKPGFKQLGNRFYVTSNNTPETINYTLYDCRGRILQSKILHNRRSFVLQKNSLASGLRILSIILKNKDGSQYHTLIKVRNTSTIQ
jgi:ligand-binding sensor domain-containing protein